MRTRQRHPKIIGVYRCAMGVWFYIINYSKREYIFLGSGEPFCGEHLSVAIKTRNWSLEEDDISVVGDREFADEVGEASRKFVALHLRGDVFSASEPKGYDDPDEN